MQECSGIFTYTNLAMRVLKKISNIVREELDAFHCQEVSLPNLQDAELWKKSNRYEAYGQEKFRLVDRKDREMFLSPTAEESCILLVKNFVQSYRDLPVCAYQIKEKYRDEIRPRFGLIRSRQFIMKDAYSFAKDEQQATEVYVRFFNAYLRIFERLKLNAIAVPADTGEIGGKFSHEFVVLHDMGESDVFFGDGITSSGQISDERELANLSSSFTRHENYPNISKCIEVGHMFYLDKTYSTPMDAKFTAEDGTLQHFIMGCYGIGVSRILSVLLSKHQFFPQEVAPFKLHLILRENASWSHRGPEKEIYQQVENIVGRDEVLIDDRKNGMGDALHDADLIGIPNRLIIGRNIELYYGGQNPHSFEELEELYVFMKSKFKAVSTLS